MTDCHTHLDTGCRAIPQVKSCLSVVTRAKIEVAMSIETAATQEICCLLHSANMVYLSSSK